MGVNQSLSRLAASRAHVLLVEVPGWRLVRMAAESAAARRGWVLASSPADADVLLVCGIPGAELAAVVDRVWNQLPGPRSRVEVLTTEPDDTLNGAARLLLDDGAQAADARSRPRQVDADALRDGDENAMDMSGHADMGHDTDMSHGMEMSHGMDMGEGMDMEMDMPMPGGIPLAHGSGDRDGLEMDELMVAVGPVLPHWPAGLVVRCVLHGDLVVSAEAGVLDDRPVREDRRPVSTVVRIATYCDDAAHVLALAGWDRLAGRVTGIRNSVVDGRPLVDVRDALASVLRRVSRSRSFRWAVGRADAVASVERWLDDAIRLAGAENDAGWADAHTNADEQQRLIAGIPALVAGTEFAELRLAIAALGIDTAALTSSRQRTHG